MNRNWIRAEATMRLDSIAGPPSTSAEMLIAMNAVAETTLRAYPDPNRQNCSV